MSVHVLGHGTRHTCRLLVVVLVVPVTQVLSARPLVVNVDLHHGVGSSVVQDLHLCGHAVVVVVDSELKMVIIRHL